MTTVWVAVYEHRHGNDIYVFTTEAAAQAKRTAIAKEYWAEAFEGENGEDEVEIPEPFNEGHADEYFDRQAGRGEYFSVEECPVHE